MKRWLRWLSKGFLVLAGLALAVIVIAAILLATVYPAQSGCEECGTHIALVIVSILAVGVAMVCVVLALSLIHI